MTSETTIVVKFTDQDRAWDYADEYGVDVVKANYYAARVEYVVERKRNE